jgi:electron transfer flavoprotein alpha subunit
VIIEHLRGEVADISYVMLSAAKVLAQQTGGNVFGVLLGHSAEELCNDLNADKVLYFDDPILADFTPDPYIKTLVGLINEEEPRAVLLGNTSIGSDIASVLSAKLDLPLVASCRGFDTDGNYLSQICGGKIMVEGELPSPHTLVTMIPGGYKPEDGQGTQPPEVISKVTPSFDEPRIKLAGYIEPEAGDVDISKEPILISVGRGIQTEDNIELAEELADVLGGAVCASRPVVDQGWISTSRLVGKSGKSVKAKLYLAMGISGAPEHIEGITDSDTIIAINTDPTAPIFDIADYGAEVDMLDLLEVLTEMIEEEID